MKRVFIVHCWGGNPDTNWYRWLADQLCEHQVHIPVMPDPFHPKIKSWVETLAKTIGTPDENIYLIGHSIGCQTILRYIEDTKIKIGGALLVAGWLNLLPEAVENAEDKTIAEPWLNTPINFDKIKNNCGKIIALFSNNDPYVPVSDSKIFEQKLDAKTIIENKGHYTESRIPTILKAVKMLGL